MTDRISPKQFHESEGLEDWRVLGDGATAYFPTGSFATAARLVQAISELPAVDDNYPDVDLRRDGVTVRMLTITDDYCGMTWSHVDLAARSRPQPGDWASLRTRRRSRAFLSSRARPIGPR